MCSTRASDSRSARTAWSSFWRPSLRAEPILDRANLVVECLVRPVAALVELEHRVHTRNSLLERHRVQLTDHGENVPGRALERGTHGVHPVAHPVLRREPPLDLGDVLAGAHPGAAE